MTNTAPADNVSQWQLGGLIFDSRSRQLRRHQQQLYLEPRQYQLLLSLLAAAGQPLSRDQLIHSVWQGRIVSDGAINRAVSVLRKAFAHLDPQTEYIETLPKLGYRLLVTATPLPPSATPAATPPLNSVGPAAQLVWWLAAVLIVLLGCAALWFSHSTAPAVLNAAQSLPHTSFDGRESQLSTDSAGSKLLYQRQADTGQHQIWLNTLADNQHRQLTAVGADSRFAALSPDGRRFAFVRYQDGQCQIMLQTLAAVGEPQLLLACPADNLPLLSWHNDGNTLYFRQRADKTQPYQLFQLNIASGALRQLTLLPADYSGQGDIALAASAWQPRLALLRYQSADITELQLLDAGGQILHARSLPLRASALAWYSDDTILLSAGRMIYQYHIGQAQLSPLYHSADAVNSLAIAGGNLYFSSTELRADIWQTDIAGTATVRINSSRLDTMPRLSHDGRQLAFLSNRQGHEQLWLQHRDGQQRLLAELPGTPGFIRPEWSADDKHILFSKDAAAYRLDIASGQMVTLLPADKQVAVANWGEHNHQLLYSSQRDGDWQLWLYDLAAGTEQKLTDRGGYSGRLWQGRLYFSKYHQDGLWVKQLPSGEEQLVTAQFDKINWLNWHIDQGQLYYYRPADGIYRLDLNTGSDQMHLAEPHQFVRHFSVRHGHTVYVRHSTLQGDIYRLPLTVSHR